MIINTRHRSNEQELMDDFEMNSDLLIETLDHIARINRLLGGNTITVKAVKKLLENHNKKEKITILDLGCGNGDMLRQLADWGNKNGFDLQLIGIDANLTTINYAERLSKSYRNISFKTADVLTHNFNEEEYDIALCTLFLHHFDDSTSLSLLKTAIAHARIGLIVNDLHRHWLAYYLFWLLSRFINNKMVKADGLISILRGFKRRELAAFANKLDYHSTIRWRWAFRFEWIIRKK